jgi:hypothetical protein
MGTPGEGELSPTLHRKSSSYFPSRRRRTWGGVSGRSAIVFLVNHARIFRFFRTRRGATGLQTRRAWPSPARPATTISEPGRAGPILCWRPRKLGPPYGDFHGRSSSRGNLPDPLAQFPGLFLDHRRCVQHGRTWGRPEFTPGRDVELRGPCSVALISKRHSSCQVSQETRILSGKSIYV